MITGANAILISTSDLSALVTFYSALLDTELQVNDHGGGRHAEADVGSVHLAIFEGPSETGPSGMTVCLHTDNIHAEADRIRARGISFEREPVSMPFGGIFGTVRDPDGNTVGLMSWQDEVPKPAQGDAHPDAAGGDVGS